MDNFNISNLSNSMINQLNKSFDAVKKVNTHLQTGKRILKSTDNTGDFAVISKIRADIKQNNAKIQNLQNALSFAQVQDGALKVVSKIIDRSSELKVRFESITSNSSDKSIYDEEFKELQLQIKSIRKSKFNGVSLFASAAGNTLFDKSQNKDNIFYSTSSTSQDIVISRAGLLGSLKIDKTFPPEIAANKAGGGSAESRISITLLGPSGTITWDQNPYSVTDHFKAVHGTDVLHEAVYGTGTNVELFDSPARTVKRTLPRTGPSQSGNRTDVFKFPLTPSNNSPTIELIVNEFGQTGPGTGWNANYQIDYDPYTLDMLDDKTVWSLRDFDIEDLVAYGEKLIDARAENGATQQRIHSELSDLKSKQIGIDSHLERSEGLDFARATGDLNRMRNKLSLNANLLKSAQDMENKLYTDFL
jgi:flagellin-like hook-associated protein FlgL